MIYVLFGAVALLTLAGTQGARPSRRVVTVPAQSAQPRESVPVRLN
ncbi:hypothetical protein [Sagittula sp. P11]|nr:hypothetical protein [Sagittula sp. P11]